MQWCIAQCKMQWSLDNVRRNVIAIHWKSQLSNVQYNLMTQQWMLLNGEDHEFTHHRLQGGRGSIGAGRYHEFTHHLQGGGGMGRAASWINIDIQGAVNQVCFIMSCMRVILIYVDWCLRLAVQQSHCDIGVLIIKRTTYIRLRMEGAHIHCYVACSYSSGCMSAQVCRHTRMTWYYSCMVELTGT